MKMKPSEFVQRIMKEMEEEGFSMWEVEYVARKLPERIKENSERIEKYKPFTIFEED